MGILKGLGIGKKEKPAEPQDFKAMTRKGREVESGEAAIESQVERQRILDEVNVAFLKLKSDPILGPKVTGMIVFGSLGENGGVNFTTASDIDLMMVMQPGEDNYVTASEAGQALYKLLPRDIQAKFDDDDRVISAYTAIGDKFTGEPLAGKRAENLEIITGTDSSDYRADIEEMFQA